MDQKTPKTAQGTDWIAAGEALLPDTVALRRAIHQEPELGLFLPRTTEKAKAALKGLPLEFREGPSTSGFMAILKGPENGRTVLLRGDMDALPLNEETGLGFASTTSGAMHACGHDTHTAMLAGAAKALCARREALAGTVMFMFQPGEEGHFGAREMMKDGLLDPAPDAAFALHISPNVPSGLLAGRPGPLLAAADKFVMKVTGQGGHASQPHDAIDPIPVACEIVMALQAMVTRRVPAFDPVMLTVARVTSGTTNNIIPETAELEGTIRSFSESSRKIVHDGIERVAKNIAAAHKCEAAIEFVQGFPVTHCAPEAFAFARKTAQNLFGDSSFITLPTPLMGAEDFSYVLQKLPGAMLMLGATPEGANPMSCCALHSNKMVIDEGAMARGIAMHCALAEAFLNEGFAA
ncbi:MAG: amidohydrolase [Pseudomonadota bacterium]|nr:amidohydrolase [Pseudomonadota bacterium]